MLETLGCRCFFLFRLGSGAGGALSGAAVNGLQKTSNPRPVQALHMESTAIKKCLESNLYTLGRETG